VDTVDKDRNFWESFMSDTVPKMIESLASDTIHAIVGRNDERTYPLVHNHPELAMVLKGTLKMETSGDSLTLSEGNMVAVARWMYHKPVPLTSFTETLWMAFTQSHLGVWIIKNHQSHTNEEECLHGLDMLDFSEGYGIALTIIEELRKRDTDWFRIVRNELSSLTVRVHRSVMNIDRLVTERDRNSRIDTLILSAQDYIEKNYTNELSIDDIAHFVALSTNYFANQFKKRTGKTIGDYISSVRMKEAERLLRDTDLLVSEISYRIGYQNPYYFSRVFHATFGKAPSEYRNDLKNHDTI